MSRQYQRCTILVRARPISSADAISIDRSRLERSLFAVLVTAAFFFVSSVGAKPLDQLYEYPQYITGQDPRTAAVADFDGDGRLDVVTANYGSDDIRIHRGLFYDKFRPGVPYKTSKRPTDIAVGDFNADAYPDIVTSNIVGGNFGWVVSVSLGNGDGTFAARVSYSAHDSCGGDNSTGSVQVLDFNGDGDDDVGFHCANSSDANATVLLGNGDGTFQGKRETDIPGSYGDLVFADVDNDNLPDLLFSDENQGITLQRGLGTGFFDQQESVFSTTGGFIISLAIGDITGDTDPDIVAVHQTIPNRLILLEGDGAGAFSVIDFIEGVDAYSDASKVVLPDTNGDNILDIAVTQGASNLGMALSPGLGGNAFAAPISYATNGVLPDLTPVDMNGDGRDDILSVPNGAGSRNFAVLMARPNGELRRPPSYPAVDPNTTANAVGYVGIGDFDADGAKDIVVSSTSRSELALLRGIGNGRYLPRQIYPTSGFNSKGLVIGDFNDDSVSDVANIVAGGASFATVMVRLGQVDAGLGPQIRRQSSATFTGMAGGDFDEDGHTDLIVSAVDNPFRSFSTDGLYLYIAGQAGGLPTEDEFNSGDAVDVVVADFDGDDHLDAAVGLDGEFLLACLPGTGTGSFSPRKFSASGTRFILTEGRNELAAGDLNGDGMPDIVIADVDLVAVLLGNGDCTFTFNADYVAGGSIKDIAIADLDGDQNLDVVLTSSEANGIMYLAGKGDGTLRTRKSYGAGAFPLGLVIDDLNGDTLPDIAISTDDNVSILLHR